MKKKLGLNAVRLVERYSFFVGGWWFWGVCIIEWGCASRGDLRYAAKLQRISHVTTMKDLCGGFLRRNLVGPL